MSMNDETNFTQIILESATRIFTDCCDKDTLEKAETGEFPEALWAVILENGFCDLGTEESGTSREDAFAFLTVCGKYALPLPIAEILLARQLAPELEGLTSIGIIQNDVIKDVPWGRRAENVIGLDLDVNKAIIIQNPEVIKQSTNIAGEPRDTVAIIADARWIELDSDPVLELAFARSCLLTGALESILEMGIQYSNERSQFGRTLSKFQVLQHKLAHAATEVCASRLATDTAIALLSTQHAQMELTTAIARTKESVEIVTDHVHQIHGAMGFTHEHILHHFTRRTWAWRDEFGNEFEWQAKLGETFAGATPELIWDTITGNQC